MTKTIAAVVAAVAVAATGCGSGSPTTKPAAPPPKYDGAKIDVKTPGGDVTVDSKDGKTKVEVEGKDGGKTKIETQPTGKGK